MFFVRFVLVVIRRLLPAGIHPATLSGHKVGLGPDDQLISGQDRETNAEPSTVRVVPRAIGR